MAKWEIDVYANPERPGILHADASARFIACDRDHVESELSGKHRFAVRPKPERISLEEGDTHCGYYARLVRDGDLFAADEATIAKCSGGTLIPLSLLTAHVEKLEKQAETDAKAADAHAKKLAAKPKESEQEAAERKAKDEAARKALAERLSKLEPAQPEAEAPAPDAASSVDGAPAHEGASIDLTQSEPPHAG